MFKAVRWALVLVVLILVTLPPAIAQVEAERHGSQPSDSKQNVLVTIRVGETDPASQAHVRTYQMVAASGGRASRVTTGMRVPIAVTSLDTSAVPGKQVTPITSYQYQEVGFRAEVRVRLLANGKISLQAEIEDSRLAAGEGFQPELDSRTQNVDAVLTQGEPLRILHAADPESGSFTLDVEASLLSR